MVAHLLTQFQPPATGTHPIPTPSLTRMGPTPGLRYLFLLIHVGFLYHRRLRTTQTLQSVTITALGERSIPASIPHHQHLPPFVGPRLRAGQSRAEPKRAEESRAEPRRAGRYAPHRGTFILTAARGGRAGAAAAGGERWEPGGARGFVPSSACRGGPGSP